MKVIGAILLFAALALLICIPVELIVESFKNAKKAEEESQEEEE